MGFLKEKTENEKTHRSAGKAGGCEKCIRGKDTRRKVREICGKVEKKRMGCG